MKRSKKEIDAIHAEAKRLRALLKAFGLTLGGWNPGVLAFQPTGRFDYHGRPTSTSLSFERREWAWLEPLLIELRQRRRDAAGERNKTDGK
jgi:hypothetical protein